MSVRAGSFLVRGALVAALACFCDPALAQSTNRLDNGNGNTGSGNDTGNGNGNNNTGTATSTVTVTGRRNTPAVVAPGLAAAGIESCLGSVSAGGAASGFGVTIAGTVTDKGCNLRLFSRTLYATGHATAATQILCNDPQAAEALAVEGVQCLVGPAAATAAAASPSKGFFGCDDFSSFDGCRDRPPAQAVARPTREWEGERSPALAANQTGHRAKGTSGRRKPLVRPATPEVDNVDADQVTALGPDRTLPFR